MQTQAISIV